MKKTIIKIKTVILCSLILTGAAKTSYYLPAGDGTRTRTGLEVFIEGEAKKYSGREAVLITNHSGSDYDLNQNIGLLRSKGIEISMVFAPEHGLYGYENEYDSKLAYPDRDISAIVYNMHRTGRESLSAVFRKTGLVIFDIQDMGMRCYTFISNLMLVIDSIEDTDAEIIVLDRPNPTDFLGADGPFLDNRFYEKNISAFPAPFLYGLTPGEAALYYTKQFNKRVKLKVVRMKNYSKDRTFNQTLLPWIPPSPNLPNYESSIAYTCTVLMEGINLSIGRGTPKPFEYIGAPWIDPVKFAERLNSLGIKGFRFKPVFFQPTFSNYSWRRCGGVQIFYTGGIFSPTEVSYKIISLLFSDYRETKWESKGMIYRIDNLAGTDKFRLFISQKKGWENFRSEIEPDLKKFRSVKKKYHLY